MLTNSAIISAVKSKLPTILFENQVKVSVYIYVYIVTVIN